jgi:hypothetical protein
MENRKYETVGDPAAVMAEEVRPGTPALGEPMEGAA